MLAILLILVFFACLAMMIREGLWSNAITLINVITAAIVATSFWEPLANWLETQESTFRYLWDFIAVWGLFFIVFGVMRTATDFISRTAVRFKMPVNIAGGTICAIWVGWVMVCFTTMTLHMAPLAPNFLGFYETTDDGVFLGLPPDRQWLGFMQKVSGGSLSTSAPEGEGEDGVNLFDPRGEFTIKYHQRRVNLDKHLEETGALRVR